MGKAISAVRKFFHGVSKDSTGHFGLQSKGTRFQDEVVDLLMADADLVRDMAKRMHQLVLDSKKPPSMFSSMAHKIGKFLLGL